MTWPPMLTPWRTAMSGRPDRTGVYLEPFRNHSFRWAWASVLTSSSGRYAVVLVAGAEVYKVTASSLWSSMVMLFLLAPVIVLGPFSGALADRFRKPRIMAIASAAAATACAAGAVVQTNIGVHLWLAVVVALFVGSAMALFSPAWQSAIPEFIGTGQGLLGAGAFTRLAMQGGEFIGPALGTPIVAWYGSTVGFAYCAAIYAAAAAMALCIRVAPARAQGTTVGSLFARVALGFRYVAKTRRLAAVITLTGLHCALTMSFLGLLPGYASEHLGDSSSYGPVITSLGLGAAVGTILLATSRSRSLGRILLITGVPSGAGLVWLGLSPTLGGALAAGFVCGASQAAFMAASYAAIQGLTHSDFRGRVASVTTIFTAGSMGVLGLGWGAAADATSSAAMLVVIGGAFVVILATMSLRPSWRLWRDLDLTESESDEVTAIDGRASGVTVPSPPASGFEPRPQDLLEENDA